MFFNMAEQAVKSGSLNDLKHCYDESIPRSGFFIIPKSWAILAAGEGQREIFEWMMKQPQEWYPPPPLHLGTNEPDGILYAAARGRHPDMVKWLLSLGFLDHRAGWIAARNGDREIVEMMIPYVYWDELIGDAARGNQNDLITWLFTIPHEECYRSLEGYPCDRDEVARGTLGVAAKGATKETFLRLEAYYGPQKLKKVRDPELARYLQGVLS